MSDTTRPETTADLPATLREYRAATHGHLTATLTAAADEIERLRAAINYALEQLDHPGGWMSHVREPLEAAVLKGPANANHRPEDHRS
jgi:hypothetical protein